MTPFAALLDSPGVVEVLEIRSRFGFMAFHGGSLERMTDVVAAEAARRSNSSFYAVLQPENMRWHLPSAELDPEASPALKELVEHVDVAVAVHGYGRHGSWTRLLLGGSNRDLAAHVGWHLAHALPDHSMVDDVTNIPPELRGMHPRNPVNLPRHGGVQLELPPRVRGLTPHWSHWQGPGLVPPVEALVEALATAAQNWPSPLDR